MIDVHNLFRAIRLSWSKETAYHNGKRWVQEHPEIDQCCVTSMLIQDYLGGDLLRCGCSGGGYHYWNRLPNGDEIDLTIDQFFYLGTIPFRNNFTIIKRVNVERSKSTMKRYLILKSKVERYLHDQS